MLRLKMSMNVLLACQICFVSCATGAIPGGCHLCRSKLEPPEVDVNVAEGCQTQPVRWPYGRVPVQQVSCARACMLSSAQACDARARGRGARWSVERARIAPSYNFEFGRVSGFEIEF